MIFKLVAPINQSVESDLKKFFAEKGIKADENVLNELVGELSSYIFLVADAEISYRFPDYIAVDDFDEKIKSEMDEIDEINKNLIDAEFDKNTTSLGHFKIDEKGIITDVTHEIEVNKNKE